MGQSQNRFFIYIMLPGYKLGLTVNRFGLWLYNFYEHTYLKLFKPIEMPWSIEIKHDMVREFKFSSSLFTWLSYAVCSSAA